MLALIAVASAAAMAPADRVIANPRSFTAESPLIRGRACGLWDADPVRRDAPSAGPRALGDEPPANLELAILRLDENGCSVPVVIRRDVSGDGRFARPDR